MKRILLIGDPNSVYIVQYAQQLFEFADGRFSVDLFATYPPKGPSVIAPYQKVHGQRHSNRLHYFLRPLKLWLFLVKNRGKYDAIQVLYCIQDLMLVRRILRLATKKLILTVFGSDFLRLSAWKYYLFLQVYASSDFITSNNSQVLSRLQSTFNISETKLRLCRFGFGILDVLKTLEDQTPERCKEHLGLSTDKILVSIGYNSNPNQQHVAVMDAIINHPSLAAYKDKICFIFPLTYGIDPAYRNDLLRRIKDFPYEFKNFDHFLSDSDLACLRKSTDIFIQLQRTDSFSASTQEYLFTQSIVITGSWLPYADLSEAGVYFRTVNEIGDIGEDLAWCLDNLSEEKAKCRSNPEAIFGLSSWAANRHSWFQLFDF